MSQSGEIPIEISQKLKTWKRDMSSRSLDFDQFRQFRKETKHPEKPKKKRNLVSRPSEKEKKVNEIKQKRKESQIEHPTRFTDGTGSFFLFQRQRKINQNPPWTHWTDTVETRNGINPNANAANFDKFVGQPSGPRKCDRRVTMAT